MEHIRAPQLWNLNAAVQKALAHGTLRPVTGVLDIAFPADHPDVPMTVVRRGTDPSTHGISVGSVIGATFDNGLGIQGINPFAHMVAEAVPGSASTDMYEWAGTVGDLIVLSLPRFVREHRDAAGPNASSPRTDASSSRRSSASPRPTARSRSSSPVRGTSPIPRAAHCPRSGRAR
jgi:hypothetical protein